MSSSRSFSGSRRRDLLPRELTATSETALEDEIADVLIYLASLARSLDIDMVDVALAKVARNEERFPIDTSRRP